MDENHRSAGPCLGRPCVPLHPLLLITSPPFLLPFFLSYMYDPHGIHRKRKADSDDQEPPDLEVIIVDPAVPAPGSSNAPRQPWLASDPAGELRQWSSPPSPHPLSSQIVLSLGPRPPKRMKFDHKGARAGSPRRYTRRPSPGKILTSRPPPIARLGNDVEDQGIVSNADPGPSSGSLLRLRGSPFVPMPMELASSSTISFIPIDPNSPHIPSLQPLINRQTLKELDLDAILRNPQLRACLHYFYATQSHSSQAMIFSLTLASNFDRHLVGENEMSPKSIGTPLLASSNPAAPVSRLTFEANPTPSFAHVNTSRFHLPSP